MSGFRDEEAAQRIRQRLQAASGASLESLFAQGFTLSPDPDLSLINLERWLQATSNPATLVTHFVDSPNGARILLMLLGAGQHLADGLIQNPELAALISDPAEVQRVPTLRGILDEGIQLLSSATSYAHKLDRLRFLKQRWKIPIVVNDLVGEWPPEQVWEALSNLADALVILATDAVWKEYALRKNLQTECPISIVGFGKLGGHELNYSSDIDLVYVLQDDAADAMEVHASRYCEMLSRALADGMGRGSLFRVDLRLRPYGGGGVVAPTMRAVEAYYRSHAEQWEAQALIRSRLLCGSNEVRERWESLRLRTCFPANFSEAALDNVLSTRERIEEFAADDDLKRGRGGIRDVEFLVQLLQMMHGHSRSAVRTRSTIAAIDALVNEQLLAERDGRSLTAGYRFLRQLEHRIQLMGDQQTHSVPSSGLSRAHLAALMRKSSWDELQAELEAHRNRIRSIYAGFTQQSREDPQVKVLTSLPANLSATLKTWLEHFPEPEVFYRSLHDNEGSISRFRAVLESAPELVSAFESSVSLTEALISGEIEEPVQTESGWSKSDTVESIAKKIRFAWTSVLTQWVLQPEFPLGKELSGIADAAIAHVCKRIGAEFDVVALGSYGTEDFSANSDADLLLLTSSDLKQSAAESQAQSLLETFGKLRRLGAPFDIDLRLRPEGRSGLLVRSHSALKAYELEGMEMWERFALGHARLVYGDQNSLKVSLQAAYALPVTPERLQDLVRMKHRIETERVQPQYFRRNVKLGYGGLSDIDWFVHLFEMRYPTATEAGASFGVTDRLRALVRAQLINAVELDELVTAHKHLLETRDRLYLLQMKDDILPENPDKLDHLAQACGYDSGNSYLAYHQKVIETVRSIYLEGLERLGAKC